MKSLRIGGRTIKFASLLAAFLAIALIVTSFPSAPGLERLVPKAHASTNMRVIPSQIHAGSTETAKITFSFNASDYGTAMRQLTIALCTPQAGGTPELGGTIKTGTYKVKENGQYLEYTESWDGKINGSPLPVGRYHLCVTPSEYNGTGVYYGQTASFEIVPAGQPAAPASLTAKRDAGGSAVVSGQSQPGTVVSLEVSYDGSDTPRTIDGIAVNSQGQWSRSVDLTNGRIATITAKATKNGLTSSASKQLRVLKIGAPSAQVTWGQLAAYYYKADSASLAASKAEELAQANGIAGGVCSADGSCDTAIAGLNSLVLADPQTDGAIAQADLAQFTKQALKDRLRIVNPTGDAPIDPARGDFVYATDDWTLQALMPLDFRLVYLSRDPYEGANGLGWHHSYEWRLTAIQNGNGKMELMQPDGSRFEFVPLSGGKYLSPRGTEWTLVQAGSEYKLSDTQGIVFKFGATGLLQSQTDRNGNAVNLSYSGDKLTGVTTNGASFTLGYNAQGRLSQVSDQTGRGVSYGYDAAGDMVSFTDTDGSVTKMGYDANHRLTSVTDPAQTAEMTVSYDDHGRVTSLKDFYGETTSAGYTGKVAPVIRGEDAEDDGGGAPGTGGDVRIDPPHGRDIADTNLVLLSGTMNNLAHAPAYKKVEGMKPVIAEYLNQWADSYIGQAAGAERGAISCTSCGIDAIRQKIDADGSSPTVIRTGGLNVESDVTFGSATHPVVVIADGMNTNQNLTVTVYGTLVLKNGLNANTSLKLNVKKVSGAYGDFVSQGPVHLNNDSTVKIDGGLYADSLIYNNGTLQVNADRIVVQGEMHINTNVEMQIAREMVLGGLVSNNLVGNLTVTGGDLFVRDNVSVNNHLNVTTGGVFAIGGDMTPNQTPVVRGGVGTGQSVLFYSENGVAQSSGSGSSTASSGSGGYQVSSTLASAASNVVTDALGHGTQYVWSNRFLLMEQKAADGATTVYGYDDGNRLVSMKDGNGNVNQTSYDERGNLTQTIDGAGASTVVRYNAANLAVESIDALGQSTRYEYDAAGNQVATHDPLGNVSSVERDSHGVPTKVTDANGKTTVLTNDAYGFTQAVQDATGYSVQIVRDSLHRVTETKDASGVLSKTAYDAKDRVVSQEDALGQKTVWAYDANGNLATVTDSAGQKTVYENEVYRETGSEDALHQRTSTRYDAVGNIVQQTDENGHATQYAYDSVGRVAGETDANGHTVSYTYDAAGNRLTQKDAEGNVTRYTYGSRDELLTVTDPLGGVTQYEYDANGRTAKVTNPIGNSTWYAYDAAGRLVKETDALGGTTQYAYDAEGHQISKTLPDGSVWQTKYDDRGLEAGAIDPLHRETSVTRNDRGLVTESADAAGHVTKYEYDELGRNTAIANALGFKTQYEYDELGRVRKVTDANGHATSFVYDSLGRLTEVTNAAGGKTSYTYDAAGNLLTKTDANGHTTAYSYNANNQVAQVVNPLGHTTSMLYDARGNLSQKIAADDTTTQYDYDAMNRLSNVMYGDGQFVSYHYDLAGRRIEMDDPHGQTRYTYDALDRLTEIIDPRLQNTRYEWTATGQRSRIIYPDNSAVVYEYDAAGQLLNVTDSSGTTSYTYDANGRISAKTLPNGGTSSYAYDAAGQVTEIRHEGSGGQLLEQLTYAYDPAGNQIHSERKEQGSDEGNPSGAAKTDVADYAYDALNELMKVQRLNGTTVDYTYDAVGNRLSKTIVAAGATTAEQYTYNEANQLLHWSSGAAWKDYEYDLRGNRVRVNGEPKTIKTTAGMLPIDPSVSGSTYDPNGLSVNGATYGAASSSGNAPIDPQTADDAALDALTGAGDDPGTYVWDAADRLIRYTDDAGNMTSYGYDGDGNRVSMGTSLVNGTVKDAYPSANPAGARDGWEPQYKKQQMDIYYMNDITMDIPEPLTAADATGTKWKQNFTYGAADERVDMRYLPSADASNDWEPQPGASGAAPNAAEKALFYLSDSLGSAVGLEAADGSISARYHYDEFGVPLEPEKFDPNYPGPDNLFGYTSLGYDYSSGLTYAHARYLDPTTGGFISQDTYKGQITNSLSLNLYTYVENNPLIYADPSGMCVAGKDAGCYVDSKSKVDTLISNPQLANNSNLWWDYQHYIEKYCKNSACVAKQKAAQKKLEKANDEIRNSACTYVDCFDGMAKFIGIDNGMPIISQETKNGEVKYSLTKVGLIQCNCFTAGTKVQTDEGEKPIEDIHTGDKVLSKNEKTGELAYKEVTATFMHSTNEIYKIHAGNQTIEATYNHPFWVKDRGWTVVKDLRIGDLLVQSNGNTLEINDIIVAYGNFTVYNMTVDDFHTYFVSDLKIWVHNTNGCFPQDPNDFNPTGLIKREFAGTKNGKIIKWFDPVTNKPIYEWNEDLKYGNHYHYTPSGNLRSPHPITGNTHIWPGDPLFIEEEEEE